MITPLGHTTWLSRLAYMLGMLNRVSQSTRHAVNASLQREVGLQYSSQGTRDHQFQ